jgi:hypothetical protein
MDEQNGQPNAQPDGPHEIELDYASTDLETIEIFVEESSDPEIFEEILRKNDEREEVVQLLYKHPNTPHNVRVLAASALNLPVPTEEDLSLMRRRAAEQQARDMQKERLVQKVAKMSVAQKVKLALKGNSEVRGILARDTNKLVLMGVIENPRITDGEILALAKNRSTLEDVIRVIMKNREWMKNYSIMYAIAIHPKTPAAIAMRHMPFLKKRDIKLLEKNKNVTEAVRTMAKKLARSSTG